MTTYLSKCDSCGQPIKPTIHQLEEIMGEEGAENIEIKPDGVTRKESMDKNMLKDIIEFIPILELEVKRNPKNDIYQDSLTIIKNLTEEVKSMPCEGTWCTGGKIPTVEGWQDCDLCNGSGRKWNV